MALNMQVLRTAPEQGSLNGHLKTFPEADHFLRGFPAPK